LNENYKNEYAYDFIKRGLILFPDSLLLKEELCIVLELQGMIEAALSVCHELIDIQPFSVDYRYIQGRLFTMLEAYDKAIESFEYISIFNAEDLEVNVMKAYCNFVIDNYDKVFEIYLRTFVEGTENIDEYRQSIPAVRPEFAYHLVRNIFEAYNSENDLSPISFKSGLSLDIENEEEANGFALIADSFPGCILYFFLKEILLMVEGEQTAIHNIEQLLEVLYHKGKENATIQIDKVRTACCNSLAAQVDHLLHDKSHVDCYHTVFYIIKYMIHGEIDDYCRLYEQLKPELIPDYFEKVFLPVQKRPKRIAKRYSNDPQPIFLPDIPSDELATRYLADKNHNN
jgi:tetratricopeptide (TPR) repeat protein